MEAGFSPMKLKRKDLEDVNHDFSDFSLSSPARKIRRLDIGLPVILEEEEKEIPVHFEQSMLLGDTVIEELPCDPVNEGKAIVLFKPMINALVHSPSSFSVSSDIITGFKNQLRSRQSTCLISVKGEENAEDAAHDNNCLAVIPWVPAQVIGQEVMTTTEVMDAEGVGEAMEIEEDSTISIIDERQSKEFGNMTESESLHQWQQQHCLTPPQLPQNTAPPVVWYQ